MIKDRSLKLIFLVSLITAVIFPVFSILYIYPSYTDLLIKNTEDEAVRTGNQLARTLFNENKSSKEIVLSDSFIQSVSSIMDDYSLMKVKVFSAVGKTIYSTSKMDIGKVNTKPYFHEIVAKGAPYSKSVKKDTKSLEGQTVTSDVVETYVPIMRRGEFSGAFELYYDITPRNSELNKTVLITSVLPLAMMIIFLVTIVTIIVRADRQSSSLPKQQRFLRFRSPFLPLGLITISIAFAEVIVMLIIRNVPSLGGTEEIILDVTLLIMMTSPTIYFFCVQPLMRYISAHHQIEEELKGSQLVLVKEHAALNDAFRQVKNAKKEWEDSMDCIGDLIIRTDSNGKIVRMNRALIEFLGIGDNKIIGCHWEDIILTDDIETTALYEGSTELYHKSSGRWLNFKAYPFNDDRGDYSGDVIVIHDNTETRKISNDLEAANKTLSQHRQALKTALEEVTALIQNATQKQNFDVRFANPNIINCYELKQCSKKDCSCYGKQNARCWQMAGTYCSGEVQGAFAQKHGNCSKCNVFKAATSDPIYEIGEHFNNMMHVLETKNREAEDAYAELSNTQSQMLQKEKMASIGQLAAGVAHEINNPMGFISSNIRTLKKYMDKLSSFITVQAEALSELNSPTVTDEVKNKKKELKIDYVLHDLADLFTESLDGADRVSKIVQNLKTFSRVDEAEYQTADINQCLESTLDIVWNELKYKATVDKIYGDIPTTKCYPNQLNQVFMNILINAAHAIEKQGEIKIKTWNGNKHINISVSDTGEGIPDDKLGKIFEPFYTTKEVGKGTGLGLSISYDIIKKHNGEISVESTVGEGTTFTLKIPVLT